LELRFSKSMKILIVIARMNVGGTATYLFNLIEGLKLEGHEVLLATGFVPKDEIEDSRVNSLPFVRIPNMSRDLNLHKDLKAWREIMKVVRDFNPDVIHTHTFKAGLLVRLSNLSKPVIHSFHGHHLYDPDYGWIKREVLIFLERCLARKTSRFITVGNRVKEELIEAGIGSASQYLSIPPGVLPLSKIPAQSVLRSFQLDERRIRVLWLGRLTRVKRPDRIILLAENFPSVDFLVAGTGDLSQNLKEKAPINVRLMGTQNAELVLSIADILISTSDSEGMPLSLIEGQMMGLPCLATNVGSVDEIIENEVTGLVVSNSDQAILQGLSRLISNQELRSQMSASSKKRAQRLFSRNIMVSSHINLYREVME
jgi:glycosyltransferase involved in cell wall biosynthesis